MNKKSLALLLIIAMIFSVIAPINVSAEHNIISERISGSNRYLTAVATSKAAYSSSEHVIIASGEDYADALAGGQLAVALNCPILLTQSSTLVSETRTEIQRLGAKKIIVLGGTNTINQSVEASLSQIGSIERIGGSDRYETSIKIAKKARSLGMSSRTLLVSGTSYPDALAAGTLVASRRCSLVLSKPNSVPDIEAEEMIVLGGTNTLPLPGFTGERISGSNRFETARLVAEYSYKRKTTSTTIIVNGMDYPDALASISMATKFNATILLSGPSGLDTATSNFVKSHFTKVLIIGGVNSVPEVVNVQIGVTPAPSDKVTITADLNYPGGKVYTKEVSKGALIDIEEVSRDNYDFIGWYDNPDLEGSPVDLETTRFYEDTTLYAAWANVSYIEEITIAMHMNYPGAPEPVLIKSPAYASVAFNIPQREGYQFAGYYNNPEGSGEAVPNPLEVDNTDINLYAQWVSLEPSEYEFELTVVDAQNNNPLEYQLDGKPSDSNGKIKVNLPAGTHTINFNIQGYIPEEKTITVGPGLDNKATIALSKEMPEGTYRIVLTWGDKPSDLDSHMFSLGTDGSIGEVYYKNKTYGLMTLDVDDRSSYGPETVTIEEIGQIRKFAYIINNYSHGSDSSGDDLARSGATVIVYKGNKMLKKYHVPNGQGGVWEVFTMDNAGIITDINTISQASSARYVGETLLK